VFECVVADRAGFTGSRSDDGICGHATSCLTFDRRVATNELDNPAIGTAVAGDLYKPLELSPRRL
jgi:hypothetical protein